LAFVKRTPFKDLLFLQERITRIFDEALSMCEGLEEPSTCVWSPPTDIYETDDAVILKIELPGIDIDGVDVEIKDDVLSLRGERKLRTEFEDEHYHRMECSYGTFQRTFTLPAVIDKNGVKASYCDGVLEIVAPKAKEPVSRHIKVDVE